MRKSRRHFTPEQKAEVVRRHLSGKEPVSDLADEVGVQPTLIHTWVRQVLDQAEKVFQTPRGRKAGDDPRDRRIAQLEAKVTQKNEVIAELMEENVRTKKANGEL
jgi:transposase-like protein